MLQLKETLAIELDSVAFYRLPFIVLQFNAIGDCTFVSDFLIYISIE